MVLLPVAMPLWTACATEASGGRQALGGGRLGGDQRLQILQFGDNGVEADLRVAAGPRSRICSPTPATISLMSAWTSLMTSSGAARSAGHP